MTPDTALTILLTLRDRNPYTFRWMSYVNSVNFPFHVLIADGGSDDGVLGGLSNRAKFPNVNYEYLRYPHDESYADFYAKVEDALSRIRTPFVAMADNDDFFVVSGLREAVQFLVDHPEYATCGGQCAVFWVTPSQMQKQTGVLYGKHVVWKCSSDAQSLSDETARDRIRNQSLRATYPIYYHVQRTEELRSQFQIVREWNPQDLFLFEQLLSFLSAIAGKTKQLDTLYMARQWNSPGSAGGAHLETFGDWLGRLLIPSWSDDFTKCVNIISSALAARDGITVGEARDRVIESYRMQVAPSLLADMLKEPTVTIPMSMVVRGVRRLLTLPPDNLIRRMARTLYRRVRWISVDAVHGTQLRARRVPGAELEFKPIREFLTRQAESVYPNAKEAVVS